MLACQFDPADLATGETAGETGKQNDNTSNAIVGQTMLASIARLKVAASLQLQNEHSIVASLSADSKKVSKEIFAQKISVKVVFQLYLGVAEGTKDKISELESLISMREHH